MRILQRPWGWFVALGNWVLRTYARVAESVESTIQALQRRYTPLGRFEPERFEGWRFLLWPALQGFFALTMILAGASFTDTPFKLDYFGTWFYGDPTTKSVVSPKPNETTLLLSIVLVFGGLVLLMRVWLRLAEILHNHKGSPMKPLYGILALWSVPMIVAPPLFSRDIFSYAAQGWMTSHHISPYIYGPYSIGSNPYVYPVDRLWAYTPAPYGPLFLSIDSAIVNLTRDDALATYVGLRLLEVAAVALMAWAIPRLARALHRDPGETLVLGVMNPLVLLTLIGGAHNDALMAALLVTGIAFAVMKRPIIGLFFCALATAIKAPAALGMVYIAWTWRGPGVHWREKIRPIVIAGVIAVVVLGVTTVIAGFGLGWVKNLGTPGTVRSWAAPATGLGLAIGNLAHLVGWHLRIAHVITITRVLGFVIALAVSGWLLWTSERRGWVRSLAVSLLLFVLLGPVVQPWYLTWGLMLLAASYVGREHFWLLLLSIVAPFVGLPGGRQLLRGLVHANPAEMVGFAAILAATLLMPLGRWTQWSWPAPEHEPVEVAATTGS